MSRFLEKAADKGYSGATICKLLNKNGVRVHVNRFRIAVNDDPDKTEREEMILRESEKILESLPAVVSNAETFARRARERGRTLKEVWEYYTTTRPQKYAYGTFTRAVRCPATPYESKLLAEAEKCLDEMTADG